MANPYSIKIVLPTEEQESAMAGAGSASTGGNSGGNQGGNFNGGGGDASEAVGRKVKQMVSFAAVKSTADQLINYHISTVSLRTGATEYEQRSSVKIGRASCRERVSINV